MPIGIPNRPSTLNLGHGTDTIVKLVQGGTEPPLIMLHSKSEFHFYLVPELTMLKSLFTTGFWAIQVTPDAPLHSIPAQAEFYFEKIKEEQPRGPYRLAAVSATSIVLVELARIFEAQGDSVIQLAFIDHFPSLLICPEIGIQGDQEYPLDDPRTRRAFITNSFHSAATFLRNDGYGTSQKRRKQTQMLLAAFYGGEPTNHFAKINTSVMERYLGAVFDFLVSMAADRVEPTELMATLAAWLGSVRAVRAVAQVYIASTGVVLEVPPQHRLEWADLGARKCIEHPRVVFLEGGHFEILSNPELVRGLQAGFTLVEAKL
ncbi:Alpha/Beta hydrolase protein [Mycena albidolilacea]|uniref:Alpha/Beta hydrolase protein n=1 Tax=Mycena albidolilacea TaxID=1033008 RepID=A0AAD6ZYZ6_9AGAR|nr:Alpha/Beta hydrolase protein [Mycena albidolilacea]